MNDWSDLVLAILGGIAAVIFASAILILVLRRGWKTMDVKFGQFETKLTAVEKDVKGVGVKVAEVNHKTEKINRAVNNVPDGTPTLVARVGLQERTSAWTVAALQLIAAHIGLALPEPPSREPRLSENGDQ